MAQHCLSDLISKDDFMIVQIFGAIDLIAAALLYFGKIPGPAFFVGTCILVLLIKGIISIFPIPFYLPGILMNLADIATVIFLYFGETPFDGIKTVVMAVLLIKSIPSVISSLFLVAGFMGSRRSK